MAIVFDCPHCKTNYRLRDEFGGKTATCKNPNCRKVIPVPMPKAGVAVNPADLDAIAAAAFADQPVQQQASTEMIEVTCLGCDHVWKVEAAKEGKNVLCPECRRPNRVPLRKKLEKADWRTGAGPSMAKKETGLDREGAFGTVGMGGISDQTAREIVKDRQAEEEPEERRKKLLKRGAIAVAALLILGAGGYFAFKTRKAVATDARMEDAVADLKAETKDGRYNAMIHRASGEYRARTSKSAEDIKAAHNDLKLARNLVANTARGPDRDFILADAALSQLELMGTTEQVAEGVRLKKDEALNQLDDILKDISDADLRADLLRTITAKFAAQGQAMLVDEFVHRLPDGSELAAQVGLELLRIDREKYRGDVEGLYKKAAVNERPSVGTLRLALGKPAPKEGKGEVAPTALATAEAAALNGEFDRAARVGGRYEERAKALAAAGNIAFQQSHPKAPDLLKAAGDLIKGEAKGLVSLGVIARVCQQLSQLPQHGVPVAESIAASLPDEPSRSWARLAILRGQLAVVKGQKAEDGWLEPIGDPAKLPAAAKAREEIARHNAANGHDYQGTVKSWPKGIVRSFGTAGLILGREDANK